MTPVLLCRDRRARTLWMVTWAGEVIVDGCRDPERDACRALLARGITGTVRFFHKDGSAGPSMDIERGAVMSHRKAASRAKCDISRDAQQSAYCDGGHPTTSEALDRAPARNGDTANGHPTTGETA